MTKRFLLYLFVAMATLCLVMYLRNPALLNKVWLWLVGMFGTIAIYIQLLWKALEAKLKTVINQKFPDAKPKAAEPQSPNQLSSLLSPGVENRPAPESKDTIAVATSMLLQDQLKIRDTTVAELQGKLKAQQRLNPQAKDPFQGTTLHLLRYLDDGSTTLGLLYSDNRFFCYTLEDTFRPVKIRGKTRIPEGDFEIRYQKSDTDLTLKYRSRAFTKGWFTYHLQLQHVPGFDGIYIHSGGDHNDTEGCILVSDGLSSTGMQKTFNNSKRTFELLYKRIAEDLDRDIPVHLRIYDEKWFTQTMTIS